MTTIKRELKAINCGQKSFYKKAYVHEYSHTGITAYIGLQSYDTMVCEIQFETDNGVIVSIENMYSKTTKRHIRDFIIQMFSLQVWVMIEKEYKKGVRVWRF